MIKTSIAREYPHHMTKCVDSNQSLYIADYTKQTESKRGIEAFVEVPPGNINYFSVLNNVGLALAYIPFNNKSFRYPNGEYRSQCECVIFPKIANSESWIFFTELKYSAIQGNNRHNLREAIKQLYKTYLYYLDKGIFTKLNTCYLIASLPEQEEPFANFELDREHVSNLKQKRNIILSLTNKVEVIDNKWIYV